MSDEKTVGTGVPEGTSHVAIASVPIPAKKNKTVTYIGNDYMVQNKFGLFYAGVPRDDLSDAQIADLIGGPFKIG